MKLKKLAAAALIAVGALAATATPATADSWEFSSVQEFGDAFANDICYELDADPQRRTIWAMVSVWQTQTNLNRTQLKKGIGYAIANYCPQYNRLYQSYLSHYG